MGVGFWEWHIYIVIEGVGHGLGLRGWGNGHRDATPAFQPNPVEVGHFCILIKISCK